MILPETEVPIVHFDHHGADFAADPWPLLADMRTRCPVSRSDAYGGFWVATRYDDIKRIALDDETFSSAKSLTIPPKKNLNQRSIPIEVDPPMFQKYRRIMHPLFSPSAIGALEPVIEAFVHRCIDTFIESGQCDFVHELADPLPAMTTLHMLGLPVQDWKRFSDPLHSTVFLRQDNPDRAKHVAGLRWIRETLVAAIDDRRAHPRNDMITYLIRSTVDGRPLDDDEVLEMVYLTIQGGFDTTGSAISSALLQLDRDRGARQRLLNDPDLLPTAVEEFLRFEAPQFALARTANRDVEIGGQNIREGDKILLVWASGNRDESVFPDADSVRLDRFPNRHMTFGLGAHRCLGSTLARREIVSALRLVLHRIPDYAVDHARVKRAETIGVTYGCFSLPATFPPGERVSPPLPSAIVGS